MTMTSLLHSLDRRVWIRAHPQTVFRYFTDSERWAAWWGHGSTIDPRPGGRVCIRYPNAVEAAGEVLAIDPPRTIVCTFGYVSGQPIPPGSSRVTITLAEEVGGTRLHLRHEFSHVAVRDHHVQGWRYQLAVFANVVANEIYAGARGNVDAWFAAWTESDGVKRRDILGAAASPGVRFRDRFSMVEGLDDLDPHLAAAQTFMPGVRLERAGEPRHCQGTVIADWIMRGADGAEMGRGANVFRLDAQGKIDEVVGLWG